MGQHSANFGGGMVLTDLTREHRIRRTLRGLARQRVALILQPGNVFVVEKVLESADKDNVADLQTCLTRGWVEVMHDAIPRGRLAPAIARPAFYRS